MLPHLITFNYKVLAFFIYINTVGIQQWELQGY